MGSFRLNRVQDSSGLKRARENCQDFLESFGLEDQFTEAIWHVTATFTGPVQKVSDMT